MLGPSMRPNRPSLAPLASSILLALLASACATAPVRAPAPAGQERRAFLWEITRPEAPERPLYLTGSVHLGQPGQFTFPPSLQAARARSQVLVVELDPEKTDVRQAQKLLFSLGAYPPDDSLSAHLDEATRKQVLETITRLGLPRAAAERMRPWLLSITLSVMELQRAGYSETGGVDRMLLAQARGTQRVVELETLEEQLHTLADLPDAVQEVILREQLDESTQTPDNLARMITAWEGGDPEALAKVLFDREEDPTYQPYYEALFFSRNRKMAERISALLPQPDTHFVVVGAGHLVGHEGLIELLGRQGLRVRQLPREASAASPAGSAP